MTSKAGFTKVTDSLRISQAALRTMALDIRAISAGSDKPKPEIVTPPVVDLDDVASKEEEVVSRHFSLRALILLIILIGLGVVFYFYILPLLTEALSSKVIR